jgi:uncharacterized short protein YbdD (DUF466 family)
MKLIWKWWNLFGQILGEGEYARYCEHLRSKHPGMQAPTPQEFYVSRLNEKYSRPNKCC